MAKLRYRGTLARNGTRYGHN